MDFLCVYSSRPGLSLKLTTGDTVLDIKNSVDGYVTLDTHGHDNLILTIDKGATFEVDADSYYELTMDDGVRLIKSDYHS